MKTLRNTRAHRLASHASPLPWWSMTRGLAMFVCLTTIAPAIGQTPRTSLLSPRVYLETGTTTRDNHNSQSVTLGMLRPIPKFGASLVTPFSLHWGFNLSHWRTAAVAPGEGHRNFTQAGVDVLFRDDFAEGASPWFLEVKFGAALFNHPYATPERRFSTAFQFTESLGLGRRIGPSHRQEISLHFQHFSNAGIREPNPGENVVRLRYAAYF
jgi:lipid A 3-O-deacylase